MSLLIDFLLIVSFVIASIPSTDCLPSPPDLVPRDRVSLCLPDEELQSHCVATEAVAQSRQLKLIHQKLWIMINPFYDGICLAVFAILLMSETQTQQGLLMSETQTQQDEDEPRDLNC